jgi:hypothetical protein
VQFGTYARVDSRSGSSFGSFSSWASAGFGDTRRACNAIEVYSGGILSWATAPLWCLFDGDSNGSVGFGWTPSASLGSLGGFSSSLRLGWSAYALLGRGSFLNSSLKRDERATTALGCFDNGYSLFYCSFTWAAALFRWLDRLDGGFGNICLCGASSLRGRVCGGRWL